MGVSSSAVQSSGDGLQHAPELDAADAAATDDAAATTHRTKVAEKAFCVLLLAIAAYAVVEAMALGLGGFDKPGAGLWPLLVAALLGTAIVASIFQDARPEPFDVSGTFKAAGIPLAIVGFVALYGVVGFVVPASLMVVVLLRFVGKERWTISLLVGPVATLLAYALFANVLGVRI